MSIFSSFFGGAKQDNTVKDLFSVNAKPVDRTNLVRERTALDVPVIADVESDESSEEIQESDETQDSKPVGKPKKNNNKDENFDLEAKYYTKLLQEESKEQKAMEKSQAAKQAPESVSESESEDESEEDSEKESEQESEKESEQDQVKEETEQPSQQSKEEKSSKAKVVDLKEAELEKAEKTVFVGNVPISVVNSKSTAKKFKHLFEKVGNVLSIRYRSISFDKALPRKLAFTQKQFHSSRNNVNAYVVFETKEASFKAIEMLNGKIFDDYHLRLDHVTHPKPKDNKRTIFVGNLDFEEEEETLWRYFNEKLDNDVESVRIVRDAKTNIGKGFALVQFKDTLSVNKALLLNEQPISADKKRKLRISRAKGNAKPSILSPNHIDNLKSKKSMKFNSVLDSLNEKQKTKLGRSKVLGKADRATAGGKYVLEGERAKEGKKGGKNLKVKKPRHKKPRIRDRSTKFKEQLQEATVAKQDEAKKAKTTKTANSTKNSNSSKNPELKQKKPFSRPAQKNKNFKSKSN